MPALMLIYKELHGYGLIKSHSEVRAAAEARIVSGRIQCANFGLPRLHSGMHVPAEAVEAVRKTRGTVLRKGK
jgi:hypothetical protein